MSTIEFYDELIRTVNSHILLDTCIASYLLSDISELAAETQKVLLVLEAINNNRLHLSDFSRYELLKGADFKKREKIEKMLEGWQSFIPCTTERIHRSVLLYNAYQANEYTRAMMKSIADCDVFIGSLIANEEKPLLLTANYYDFPRPFFKEVEIWPIEFTKKGKKNCYYFYLLEADLDAIIHHQR